MKITKTRFSLIWAFLIISSAAYARPVYNSMLTVLDRRCLVYITAFSILLIFFCLFCRCRLSKLHVKGQPQSLAEILLILVAVAVLATLFYNLAMPEEKIHILIFAVLGLLRVADHSNKQPFPRIFIFILTVSLGSELFQAVLPDRFFDFRDIFTDTLSGCSSALILSTLKRNDY